MAERNKLDRFAVSLQNNPPLDDMIERLKTTLYPRRNFTGRKLYNHPNTTVEEVLNKAIYAKLDGISRSFGTKAQKRNDIAKVVLRLIDAVFLPMESANAPVLESANFDRSGGTATYTILTKENEDFQQLELTFKHRVVNGDARTSLEIVLTDVSSDDRYFDSAMKIEATETPSTRADAYPTTLKEFMGRLLGANRLTIGTKKHPQDQFDSSLPKDKTTDLLRSILMEGALLYPDYAHPDIMVRGSFADLAVADVARS